MTSVHFSWKVGLKNPRPILLMRKLHEKTAVLILYILGRKGYSSRTESIDHWDMFVSPYKGTVLCCQMSRICHLLHSRNMIFNTVFLTQVIVIRYISVWRAPKSWSEYKMMQHARAGQNTQPTSKSEKLIKVNAT